MKENSIPENVKKMTEEFTGALKNIYGDKLISVVLYGTAASGEYALKHSNINVAVVLEDASIEALAGCAGILNKRKFRAINPIFFTEDYIKRSTDVFPIEFLDMKENNIILYGRDILKDLDISIKNLRFQCEQELKSKIINLKRVYLRTKNFSLLKNILFKSITSAIHILRNIIRLKGKAPAYAKEDVVDLVGREFGVDVSALQKILDARIKNTRLAHAEAVSLFSSLIGTLEIISDKIDRM